MCLFSQFVPFAARRLAVKPEQVYLMLIVLNLLAVALIFLLALAIAAAASPPPASDASQSGWQNLHATPKPTEEGIKPSQELPVVIATGVQ